jgi:uncharacterized paraquat-inducible protein A
MKRFPTARSSSREEKPLSPLRAKLHEIIFEADTPAGKSFDVILLVAIILSVTVAMLDTVAVVHERYGIIAVPTGIFSVELVAAARQQHRKVSTQVCTGCAKEGHEADAVHCKFCGSHL